MSNMASGRYEHDRWEYFDSLPSSVRRILACADYDWCVGSFLSTYRQSGNAVQVIAEIRHADIDEHRRLARRERRHVFYKGGVAGP